MNWWVDFNDIIMITDSLISLAWLVHLRSYWSEPILATMAILTALLCDDDDDDSSSSSSNSSNNNDKLIL